MKGAGRLPVQALSSAVGARVDTRLDEDFSDADRDQLRQLFAKYHLLYFEASGLEIDRELEVFEIFAKAIPPMPFGDNLEVIISNTREDGLLGSYEIDWHQDGSFFVEPFTVMSMHALDVEDGRSSTKFADTVHAAARLPDKLKETLRYRQVINTSEIDIERGRRLAETGGDLIASAHRILSTHPVTGQTYVAANSYQSDCVLGLGVSDSSELLAELYEHIYAPENVYEHWWNKGDLVIWDNLAVHHARGDVTDVGARTLRRFTAGTATMREQMPPRHLAKIEADMKSRLGPKATRRLMDGEPSAAPPR